MCLYTPQAAKGRSKGPLTNPRNGTLKSSKTRQAMPRHIVVNQPMSVPPPQLICPQQPRIELVGDGERTHIYLPTPTAQNEQGSKQGGQKNTPNVQGQNNGQERRRSSMLVAEVKKAMELAKRVGEAARRSSASSFGRGREYEHERERRREIERSREVERLSQLERDRERDSENLEKGGSRRARSRERRSDKDWRERKRRDRTPSSSRSRSGEKITKTSGIEERDFGELKVVDEEARHLAQYAALTAEQLVRDRDIKKKAKELVEQKEKKEERLANRVLSRYGAGGLLTPPLPPQSKGRFDDWDEYRGRRRDWRDGVSWAPWNENSWANNGGNYISPPPPLQLPPQNNYSSQGSVNGANNNGNVNGDGRNLGSSRSRSRERRQVGSNHIHVHTAPIVQGPQISTMTPSSAGAYGDMPGMTASFQSASRGRPSFSDPVHGIARSLERGANAPGYGGMGSGYGMGAMPQLREHRKVGSVPMYGMHGMGSLGMGVAQQIPVPVGERQWQRARVYNATTHDPGMGGMMY